MGGLPDSAISEGVVGTVVLCERVPMGEWVRVVVVVGGGRSTG